MQSSDFDTELDPETRALLARYGFEQAAFETLRARLVAGAAEDRHNRLTQPLMQPEARDIAHLAPLGSRERAQLYEQGLAAIGAGQVAVAILAGGMATRFGGVVKAAVPVLAGDSFLTLKLRDLENVARLAHRPLRVCLMTSFATDAPVREMATRASSRELRVETFPQSISLRLAPNGELFRERSGRLSPYAPGHGDFSFALRRSGILQSLRKEGVRYLFLSNVDNLAATLEPAIIGLHLARAAELSFEVVTADEGDKGGVPAHVDGRLQVIEALRYPLGFEEHSIPLFSINNFVFDLDALDRDFELTWFRVTKQVEGQPAVQFERFVNQLTAHLGASGLRVEREGADGRFLPVKDPAELTMRLPAIERLVRARLTQR